MDSLEEKRVRNLVRQELGKYNGLKETDLVATDKSSWDNKKAEFKTVVQNLLNNIETDDYNDAEGYITKAITTLKVWKSRIEKGLADNATMDEGN